MTDSNHNNPVLSYDELGFIIGMKRVEKKVSTIDSNIEKIIDILTQSFEEQKVQLTQPQPKLTEFQKMLNAVNNRQALDFEDLLKEKANPITQSFVVADKLVKDFADILEQSVDDLKTVEKKHINQPKSLKPAIEINSHEDLSKIVNPSVPERDEKGRFVSNPNEPQNQSSIRKVAQTITTVIKGVMPNSPQGVDPTVASVHNTDMVKTQIKELLVERYGRESLSSSRWLVNGFNTQEMGKLINDNIVAFQDRMSDFTIMLSNELNKPNEWVYVTKDSITVELERTADISGATWTL